MNEFNDIDRELQAAFTQRPTALSRPSLRDVKQRARRHQRQRSAGVLGACALVGIGGVAALAQRSPANQTALGEGGATFPASTICFPTVSTFIMDNTPTVPMTGPATEPTTPYTSSGTYIVQEGDNPTMLAQRFGFTLEALNAANEATPGYDIFYVGLEIAIPVSPGWTTTTMPADFNDAHESFLTYYVLQEGDYPKAVADAFGVTVAELDAANLGTEGYSGFILGTAINIPFPSQVPATTTTGFADTADTPEPTAWTTTTDPTGLSIPATLAEINSTDPNCVPVPASTIPGGDSTTTSSIPNFTKIGTSIQVANCSNQEGAAGYLSSALAEEGFTLAEPDTCTIDLPVTRVIYNPDDPLAFSVALTLSVYLNNAVLESSGPVLPTLTLGTWAYGSGVLVLLGDDLAGKTLAQIASNGIAATSTTVPLETGVTVTTCIMQPQMTLPLPATTTSIAGSC